MGIEFLQKWDFSRLEVYIIYIFNKNYKINIKNVQILLIDLPKNWTENDTIYWF